MTSRRHRITIFGLALALALGTFSAAIAQDDSSATIAARDDPALGSILVDPSGWTLYTFANDPADASACTGGCTDEWPPLLADMGVAAAPELPGTLTAFPRDDGAMQLAYNDAPLYYFSGDAVPGDTKGNGDEGMWFAASSGLTPARVSPPLPAVAPVIPASPAPAPQIQPAAKPTPPINNSGTNSAPPANNPAPPAATPMPAPAPQPYPMSPRY
jgi:predicted lipoprotein with Yx(FWY)xxD motif